MPILEPAPVVPAPSRAVELEPDTLEEGETPATKPWSYTFTDLPKYVTGQTIDEREVLHKYTVIEEKIAGYKDPLIVEAEGRFTITNTHTPILIDIDGTKTWNDANDQDGIRPETITVNLLADGKVVRTITVAAPAAEAGETGEPAETNEWTYSFTGLPKYRDHGTPIKYTVEEILPEGYEANYTGTHIANKHVPELIDVPVRKVWDDLNDRHGFRPETAIGSTPM